MMPESATSDASNVQPAHDKQPPSGCIKPPAGWGHRHLQVLLLFLGLANSFSLRVNLSVGIVAMTTADGTAGEVYDWDESTQGLILSSFFWGYIVSQIPASQLALAIGAKTLLCTCGLACGVLTLITPWMASYSWTALLATRMLMGLFQGVFFPCTHTVLSKWAHPMERGRLASITYSGMQVGTVIMLAVSGLIASSFMGWPGIFYCSGAVSLLWSLALYVYGANSPAECAGVSQEERAFIESMPGSSSVTLPIPWREIFTSKPVLALLIVHCTNNWGYWTLLTLIPSYMKQVLGFDIKTNSLLSALPYLALWVLIILICPLSDYLINAGHLSVSYARKMFNSISHWGSMLALIALAYATDATLAIFLLTVAVSLIAGTNVGYLVNHIDLSPNFAGTLMAITNSIANVLSLLAPLAAGFMLQHDGNATSEVIVANWRSVFFVAAGFYLVGNLIFVVGGKGNIQPFNQPKLMSTENGLSIDTLATVDIADQESFGRKTVDSVGYMLQHDDEATREILAANWRNVFFVSAGFYLVDNLIIRDIWNGRYSVIQ